MTHRADSLDQLLCADASSVRIRTDAGEHEHMRVGCTRLLRFRVDKPTEECKIRLGALRLDFYDIGALGHRTNPAGSFEGTIAVITLGSFPIESPHQIHRRCRDQELAVCMDECGRMADSSERVELLGAWGHRPGFRVVEYRGDSGRTRDPAHSGQRRARPGPHDRPGTIIRGDCGARHQEGAARVKDPLLLGQCKRLLRLAQTAHIHNPAQTGTGWNRRRVPRMRCPRQKHYAPEDREHESMQSSSALAHGLIRVCLGS